MADSTSICVFGLGEAGSSIASDLVSAGAEVTAFDPAEVPTPEGVERRVHPALAARPADVIVSVTAADDAKLALLQSLEVIGSETVYADLSTAAPQLKNELAEQAGKRDVAFADVALLATVPGRGLATPAVASGPGAERFAAAANELGGSVETVDGPPGTAAAKKLLRSVMMKGVAAVTIEALRAGAAADDLEWLWANLASEVDGADEAWLHRLVTGSKTHAPRRKAEMEAAKAMLDGLGVPAGMTEGTIASLTELLDGELPPLPASSPALSSDQPSSLSPDQPSS